MAVKTSHGLEIKCFVHSFCEGLRNLGEIFLDSFWSRRQRRFAQIIFTR
jgi:hypothetical protein